MFDSIGTFPIFLVAVLNVPNLNGLMSPRRLSSVLGLGKTQKVNEIVYYTSSFINASLYY